MSIDYRRAFVRALYEQMCETYDAHGIEAVYEDEFVGLAAELMHEYLEPTIREFREEQGLVGSVVPRMPIYKAENILYNNHKAKPK